MRIKYFEFFALQVHSLAWDRWREHAQAQRRMFGVARKVAGRMLHRW